MKYKIVVLLIMIMISGMTGNVFAAMQRGQAGGQNDGSARLQQMLRKLALERDRLRKENGVMTKDLADLNKDHEKLISKQKKTKAKLTRAQKTNEKYKERVILYGNKLRELIPRLRTTLRTLGQAKTTINDQSSELLSCMNYNIKLFDAGSEMLVKYEEKGVWDALAQAEPLTQLKQVEIENVIEDYRYKMLDLQVLSKAEDIKKINNVADNVISSVTTDGQKTLAETEKVGFGSDAVTKTKKIITLDKITTISGSTQNAGLSTAEVNLPHETTKN